MNNFVNVKINKSAMNLSKKILLSLISGGLLALSFPPSPFFLMAFVGFVPLLFIFSFENVKYRFLILYITFFIYHTGTNWWIGSWQENADPYLMMSGIVLAIAHPFFFMIPFWGLFYLKRKIGYSKAIWIFPFLWTSFEWLHSLGEFSYPWLTIGNTQILNRYWIQFIDISGVWGASFLILLINVLIFKIIEKIRNNGSKLNIDLLRKNLHLKLNFLLLIIFILFPLMYSIDKITEFNHDDLLNDKETINISLIQANIDPWEKWEGSVHSQIRLYKNLQDSLSNEIGDIDLSIWSETAIPFLSLNFNAYNDHTILERWIDRNDFSILTGFSEFYFYKPGEKLKHPIKKIELDTVKYYITYNSSLLLNPFPDNKLNPQIYRKSKLTPFAERFPYSEILTFAQEWMNWGVGISAWGLGEGAKSMTVIADNDSTKIGSIICIESVYPKFVTGFVRDGAQILSVITNDSWFDKTPGPMQHYLIAAVRAIETRRYIARSANSGITGFISPTGKNLYQAEPYVKTAIAMTVPKLEILSFYVKFGDWLPIFTMIVSLLMIIQGIITKKK